MSSSPSSSSPPPSPSAKESQDPPDNSPPSKESEEPPSPPAAPQLVSTAKESRTTTDEPDKMAVDESSEDKKPPEGNEGEENFKVAQVDDDSEAAATNESIAATDDPDNKKVEHQKPDDDKKHAEERKEAKESKDSHDSSPKQKVGDVKLAINDDDSKEPEDNDNEKALSRIKNEIEIKIGDEESEEKNRNDVDDDPKPIHPMSPSGTQKNESTPAAPAPAASSLVNTDNDPERQVDEAEVEAGKNDDCQAKSPDISSDTLDNDDKLDQPRTNDGNDDDDNSKPVSNPDDSSPVPMSLESTNQSSDGTDDVLVDQPAPKEDQLPPLSLHDCVSLGEIELGLAQNNKAVEEIQCLPLLLRLLSLTRPLSTIEILQTEKEKSSPPSGDYNETEGDSLVNGLVARLELVAATHSMAEGVDVVTCHLAPSMSRKLSKLPPLSTKQDGTWDTAALSAVARNPIPSSRRVSKRRRLSAESASNEMQAQQSDDGIEGSSEDEDETSMMLDEQTEGSTSNKRRRMYSLGGHRDSFGPGDGMAAEDSQEATFTKTLSELASLVASSLEALPVQDTAANVEEAQQSEQPQTRSGQFSLTIDDSILAESGVGSDEGVGGAMARSDLGSTVASIMHHSPVLRSRHVANALCRAAIPQAGDLLKRMGANCPASIPCLLRGCTDAYWSAIQYDNPSIASAAKKGVVALAQLSPRERSRVQSMLSASFRSSMLDVQLKLALEAEDSTSVCCLLVRNLSRTAQVKSLASERAVKATQQSNNEQQENSKQTTGDTSSGFRHHLERDYNLSLKGKESSLGRQLKEDTRLLETTMEFFVKELQNLSKKENEMVPLGKLCLALASTIWLLLAVSSPSNVVLPRSSVPLSSLLLDKLIPELDSVSRYLKARIPTFETTPEISGMDRAFCLVQGATVVAWATFLLLKEEDAAKFGNECCSVVTGMRKSPSLSKVADSFVAGTVWMITNDDTSGLHAKIMNVLCNSDDYIQRRTNNTYYPTSERGLKLFCSNAGGGPPDSEEIRDISVQISALLLETQADSQSDGDRIFDRVKDMLKRVLTSGEIRIDSLICSDEVAKFVVESTLYLVRPSVQPKVPAILHVQIEALGSKLDFWRLEGEETALNQLESQFLLQLLHAFEFMDLEPQSPFVLCPRALPIRHAVTMCRHLISQGKARFLTSRLEDQIQRHLPDIYHDTHVNRSLGVASTIERHMSGQEICSSLLDTIRACLVHHSPDKYAPSLEGLFLLAKRQLPDSDLGVNVASALLASPNKPPPFFTYALLCEDPLVLLKCPMKVWHCRGLRRIALALLYSLLEANGYIVMETSPSESSGEELLAARNAVVLRCLLIAMSGADSGIPALYCSMTTSVIRWLIASQPGLVAIVIKQGLPDAALDWLIEFVPETMGDSQDLIHLISDRGSLAPAERLVAADAVLRIAIAHGHSNEAEAQGMAYSALTQLVNCFFLVVGPVGVPVNALVGDGSGLDVTQISRNAAFRILKSLLKVRGKRERLRNECGMALQKLANLCKGETVFSGVAGAVAGRRKILLKEIFDAVMKAVNSMGSTVGSQSVAA